jgi:hypothetical protein
MVLVVTNPFHAVHEISQKYLPFCSKFMYYKMRSVKGIYPNVHQQSKLFEAFQQHLLFIKKYAIRKMFNLLELSMERVRSVFTAPMLEDSLQSNLYFGHE